MNVVTLASACSPSTTTSSMLATNRLCLAAAHTAVGVGPGAVVVAHVAVPGDPQVSPRSAARSPFWMAASKFSMVARTWSSCDSVAAPPRVSSTGAQDGQRGQRGDDQHHRDHTSPAAVARRRRLGGVLAWRDHLRGSDFGAVDGLGGGAGGEHLGGRFGHRVDDLGGAVEARRCGEAALGGIVGTRFLWGLRGLEDLGFGASSSGCCPSPGSVGFDIPAAVLPRERSPKA